MWGRRKSCFLPFYTARVRHIPVRLREPNEWPYVALAVGSGGLELSEKKLIPCPTSSAALWPQLLNQTKPTWLSHAVTCTTAHLTQTQGAPSTLAIAMIHLVSLSLALQPSIPIGTLLFSLNPSPIRPVNCCCQSPPSTFISVRKHRTKFLQAAFSTPHPSCNATHPQHSTCLELAC